ncbi:Hypothetical predicted protein [Cloeon dipterum]|uniref:Uncharacterized protein n=2 Tax=Cloeon dipterum TaxID=197152 RepID=A0A8S1DWL7_9INSE|nr:Hypothetical predicted protein [Cloeon dipterum]
MTSIRQTTTTMYSSNSAHPTLLDNGSPMDGSLDLLLEDLQSSVSRPGSSVGHNNLTNGHVTTTTTTTKRQQHYGQPHQPEQHVGGIQYLQPMNSTTVVAERASSPHTVSSYKTYQYQYTTSSATPQEVPAPQQQQQHTSSTQYQYRGSSPQQEVPDTRLRQNLNELDSLLVDLHHAQQSTPLEPNELSSSQHVSRVVRTFQQQQYQPPQPQQYQQQPQPYQQPQQADNHTYGTPNTVRRELQYPPSPKLERSSSLNRRGLPGVRAPSPSRQVTTTVKTYTYEIPADNGVNVKPVVGTPIVNTYSYEIPVDQPKPEDTIITYKYAGLPKTRALEPPKEPPVLVDRPINSYSLHYTMQTQQSEPPHKPFPSPAMTPPPSAEPPKRLEELLASFSDTVDSGDMHNEHPVPAAPLEEYLTEVPIAPPSPVRQRKIEPEKPSALQQERMMSKNIAGPPVYYPPGVEMFAKKDEPVRAKMKEGASSSESKSSGGGVAAVPVCLPVCCAMPCVIM